MKQREIKSQQKNERVQRTTFRESGNNELSTESGGLTGQRHRANLRGVVAS